jgi:AbrB family looped-hinge helix DNA binding protein
MITEFRKKSQITIPKEVVTKLGLIEGDKLEIIEKDGMIWIMPVVVYTKKYLEELCEEVALMKNKLAQGTQPVFDHVEDLFKQLDSEQA